MSTCFAGISMQLKSLSGRQWLLFGFIVALLIAIPITLYVVKQQQKVKVGAAKSTILSFDKTPGSNNAYTATVTSGSTVTLPVYVDPGSGDTANTLSVATLEIKYDPTKLSIADQSKCIDTTGSPFQPVNKGAVCTPGDATVYLAAGDIRSFVTSKTQIASITFLVNPAATGTTQVSFDPALTLAGSASDNDPETNVISQMLPATLTIGSGPTPTPGGLTPTLVPSGFPTPTPVVIQPTTAAPTPIPLPMCTSFSTDVAPTGTAPFAINFTANGSDQNAAITKATFNLGDGTVQDVAIVQPTSAVPTPTTDPNATPDPNAPTPTPAQSQQAGAPANNAQLSHTYNSPGTYQASVTFTDANGATSLPDNCIVRIQVNPAVQPTIPVNPTATPTMAPTGPGETIMGIGIVGLVLSVIGGVLFFAL